MDVIQNLLTLPVTYFMCVYFFLILVSFCISYKKTLGTSMKNTFVGYNVLCLFLNLLCSMLLIGLEIGENWDFELIIYGKDDILGLFYLSKYMEMLEAVFILFFINKHKSYVFPICADVPMFFLADYAYNFAQFKSFCRIILINSIFQILIHLYYCISVIYFGEFKTKLFGFILTTLQLLEYTGFTILSIIGYVYSGNGIFVSFLILITFCYFIIIIIDIEKLIRREDLKNDQKEGNKFI